MPGSVIDSAIQVDGSLETGPFVERGRPKAARAVATNHGHVPLWVKPAPRRERAIHRHSGRAAASGKANS